MSTRHQPTTLRSVAEEAGVSVATASRALAGRGDLSLATRERVVAAAEKLHYDRSSVTRGRPTTLDPHLIEFVLGSFDDAWTEAMTTGAREAAFRLGFDLVLTLERSDPRDDWPTRVATRRPSGAVIGIISPTTRQLNEIHGLRIPIVLLEPRSDPEGTLMSVGTTDWQGGYDAGAHLAECPVERFIVISGVPHYRFGRAREAGFRQAIADHRPDAQVVHVESDWTASQLSEPLMRAISGDRTPVGVFACNDEMALTVYRAADRLHLRIPTDVSVIGFNDEPRAASASPPLTSVRQPLVSMAAKAVELVHQLRQHPERRNERVELPTELIIRESTTRVSPKRVSRTRPTPPPAE